MAGYSLHRCLRYRYQYHHCWAHVAAGASGLQNVLSNFLVAFSYHGYRIHFAAENMQHFSLTRHAFVALLIQLALFRVYCTVHISIWIWTKIYISKCKRRKMTIIRYGGYLSKHIVNTMSELWAITMLYSKLLKIYVSYDKGAKSNV